MEFASAMLPVAQQRREGLGMLATFARLDTWNATGADAGIAPAG